MKAQLARLAGELAVEDCTHFIGHVADEVLPDMYAAADVFVLPTTELGCFGLIALEALAGGGSGDAGGRDPRYSINSTRMAMQG